jgi:hypothetical protein
VGGGGSQQGASGTVGITWKVSDGGISISHLGDLSALVVAAGEGDSVRIPHLPRAAAARSVKRRAQGTGDKLGAGNGAGLGDARSQTN